MTLDDTAIVNGGYPAGLRWLVDSLKNSCRCHLLLCDVNGARWDAFATLIFLRNADLDMHECLTKVCSVSLNVVGELQGLKFVARRYNVVKQGIPHRGLGWTPPGGRTRRGG